MSTLTKIFTVLMVIFSIAFTMATIGFVGKTVPWKELAEGYRQEQMTMETHLRNAMADHVAEKAYWRAEKQSLNDQFADLNAELQRQAAELASLKDEATRLRAEKSSAEALSSQLASQLKVAQEGWFEQRDQRASVEERNMELERRNLDLSERVSAQSARIVVLVQQQQQLEQQLNIMQEEMSKLARGGRVGVGPTDEGRMEGVSQATPTTVAPIRGRIVEIDGNLATISVGSSDGVREGMVFVIYRGSEYIGDVEITDVEPNLAAGRVVGMRAQPQSGDRVADEPALGLAR